jgi:TRAP-type uncharacterized transport system fused permease subunit
MAEVSRLELEAELPTASARGSSSVVDVIAKVVALAMAAFQLYTALTVNFSPMMQRSLHLAFALCLLYLVVPSRPGAGRLDLTLRCIAAALSVLVTVYAAVEFTNPGIFRAIDPTSLDIVFGTILVVLLLEATRRVAGASSQRPQVSRASASTCRTGSRPGRRRAARCGCARRTPG